MFNSFTFYFVHVFLFFIFVLPFFSISALPVHTPLRFFPFSFSSFLCIISLVIIGLLSTFTLLNPPPPHTHLFSPFLCMRFSAPLLSFVCLFL